MISITLISTIAVILIVHMVTPLKFHACELCTYISVETGLHNINGNNSFSQDGEDISFPGLIEFDRWADNHEIGNVTYTMIVEFEHSWQILLRHIANVWDRVLSAPSGLSVIPITEVQLSWTTGPRFLGDFSHESRRTGWNHKRILWKPDEFKEKKMKTQRNNMSCLEDEEGT